MSGKRMSGTSRPSLGAQVLALFSFFFEGKSQVKECLGKRLEVPDVRVFKESCDADGKWFFCPSLFNFVALALVCGRSQQQT